jgi:hypothetical protein
MFQPLDLYCNGGQIFTIYKCVHPFDEWYVQKTGCYLHMNSGQAGYFVRRSLLVSLLIHTLS